MTMRVPMPNASFAGPVLRAVAGANPFAAAGQGEQHLGTVLYNVGILSLVFTPQVMLALPVKREV